MCCYVLRRIHHEQVYIKKLWIIDNYYFRNFCSDCKCNYVSHYVPDSNDKFYDNLMDQLCDVNNSLFKLFEETSRLAKKFGLLWLPIGIQPSEVLNTCMAY